MMMRDDFPDDQFSDHQLSGYPFPNHGTAEPLPGMRLVDSPRNGAAPPSAFRPDVEALANGDATAPADEMAPGRLPQSEGSQPEIVPLDDVTTETSSETLAQTTGTAIPQNGWGVAAPEAAASCLTDAVLAASGPADAWSQPVFRPLWTVDDHKSSSGRGLGDEAGVVISTFTGASPAWKHWVREGLSIGRDVLLALVIALLIGLFVIQPVYVKGTSMLPHLHEGERLFVNRFIYNFSKIERGDIVVFYYPKNPQESFIKRVIGLPGDEVTLANGKLYINGKLVPEGYLSSDYTTIVSPPRTWVVEPHHYFVMGDNRDASNDSRNWGLVPEMYIYGKAVYRYWPVSEMGFIEGEPTVLEPLRRLQRMEDRPELPPAE
ncbi:signal peptidase I [Chloracidobacterium thermophilum]|uniref:signal peptidase I n=1 Tax=Chloracidobacterium thermophilum TaxID=458033 RepID=UPI0007388AAF|nr:signal peptidase I [Chloracidobacterium thermophilum]